MNSIADSIFLGGNIITVNDALPSVDALAVKGGKIMAVGTVDEVLRWKGNETQVVDLQGKTLMPGFIEPHGHQELGSISGSWIQLHSAQSKEQIIEILRKQVPDTKPGVWIIASLPINIEIMEQIDIEMLDGISTEHPICILLSNCRLGWVNHKGLEIAGIRDEITDPGKGSSYARDSSGKLTGRIVEVAALYPVFKHTLFKGCTPDKIKNHLDEFTKLGFTTVYNAGGLLLPGSAKMFEDVIKEQRKIRFVSAIVGTDVMKGLVNLEEIPTGDDFFHYQGVKFFHDGGLFTAAAYMDEPYLENDFLQIVLGLPKNNFGSLENDPEELQDALQKVHDAGQQIIIHTCGDRSLRELVEIYKILLATSPRFDHRHRLEHSVGLYKEEAEAAAKLGLMPSYLLGQYRNFGETLRDKIYGAERVNKMIGIRTGINAGLLHSMHQDSPINLDSPFKVMHFAVTRKTAHGSVIGADEAITIDEAIKGYSINAANHIFMEDKIGSLEVGKYADMVIVSENPKEIPADDLEKVDVLQTYVEGKLVYSQI